MQLYMTLHKTYKKVHNIKVSPHWRNKTHPKICIQSPFLMMHTCVKWFEAQAWHAYTRAIPGATSFGWNACWTCRVNDGARLTDQKAAQLLCPSFYVHMWVHTFVNLLILLKIYYIIYAPLVVCFGVLLHSTPSGREEWGSSLEELSYTYEKGNWRGICPMVTLLAEYF